MQLQWENVCFIRVKPSFFKYSGWSFDAVTSIIFKQHKTNPQGAMPDFFRLADSCSWFCCTSLTTCSSGIINLISLVISTDFMNYGKLSYFLSSHFCFLTNSTNVKAVISCRRDTTEDVLSLALTGPDWLPQEEVDASTPRITRASSARLKPLF